MENVHTIYGCGLLALYLRTSKRAPSMTLQHVWSLPRPRPRCHVLIDTSSGGIPEPVPRCCESAAGRKSTQTPSSAYLLALQTTQLLLFSLSFTVVSGPL